jgi:hypothetical protein
MTYDPNQFPYEENNTDRLSVTGGEENTPIISETTAARRSFQASLGLNKSYTDIYQEVIAGREQQFREQAASEITYQKALQRERKVAEALALGRDPATYMLGQMPNVQEDPRSVIEKYYSKAVLGSIDFAAENNPGSYWGLARMEMPKATEAIVEKASSLEWKRQYLRMRGHDIEDALGKQSWGGWGVDFAKTVVPFYTEAQMGSWLSAGHFSGLRGNKLEDQRNELMSLPDEEFKNTVDRMKDYYITHNPQVGKEFFENMYGQTADSVYLNNFFTAFDASMLGPVAKGLGKGAIKLGEKLGLLNSVTKGAKDMIQETASAPLTRATIAEGTGDVAEAAVQQNVQTTVGALKGAIDPFVANMEAFQQVFRIGGAEARKNPGPFRTELSNRIAGEYESLGESLGQMVAEVAKVERIPAAMAVEKIIRGIKDAVLKKYAGINNTILNISDPYIEPLTSTKWVDTFLGRVDGTLFRTKTEAENFMNVAQIKGADIKEVQGPAQVGQKGVGWYLRIPRPIDEEWDVIRNNLLTTKESQVPESWSTMWARWVGGGKYLSTDNQLSLDHRQNRKIATYAPARLMEMYVANAKAIGDLKGWALPGTTKRQKWEEWKRVVDSTGDLPDRDAPVGSNKLGYDFKGPGELAEHYVQMLGRLPDEQEVHAYFAWKQNKDMDLVFRRLEEYKRRSIRGFEGVQFSMIGDNNTRVLSGFFDGKILREMPGGNTDPVLIIGKRVGMETWTTTEKIGNKRWAQLAQEVKEGKRYVIEAFDVPGRPLEGLTPKIGDKRVRYIITDNVQTKPLDLASMLSRRGGPHQEFDYRFYLKQARIIPERVGKAVIHGYEGDTTLLPISVRAMGVDVARRINEMLPLIDKGKWAEVEAMYNNSGIHIPFDQFKSWFSTQTGPGGVKIPPRLGTKEPIQVVESGSMIGQTDNNLAQRYTRPDGKSTFVDYTRGSSASKIGAVEFSSERDAYDMFTLRNEGTVYNPLYKVAPAKTIDPISSMNRALSRIVHSSFLNDYKKFAMEHWLQLAKPYLDVEQLSQIKAAPLHFFHNMDPYKSNAPDDVKRLLDTQRAQINQLLGRKTTTDIPLQDISQKLYDSIYTKFGPRAIFDEERRAELPKGLRNISVLLDPVEVLPRLSDPVRFIRAMVFHPKMGMFNPAQYMTQLQTFSAINAIAGADAGMNGTYGAYLHALTRFSKNPNIIADLDAKAVASRVPGMKWKPGQWKEAHDLLDRTGFGHVGGEYANLDDMMAPKTIQSGIHQVFDWGTVFFKEGERQVRYGAWFTAYREFRAANPTRRITDADTRSILERADLLNMNMSRASNTALHSGILSIPTQFLTYQLRTAELFFSKRLTDRERARLVATYSALYGLPTAYGVTGLPVGDFIRQSALENGYVVGDEFLSSLVNEGLPAMAIAMVTGLPSGYRKFQQSGDLMDLAKSYRSGDFYNIGDRWGIQGFETIREALRGDKSFWDIIGGAAFSTIKGAFEQSDGFRTAMMSGIRGDSQAFPIKIEDFVDIFKEAGSVNSAYRSIVAFNTGRWMSKKGMVLDSDVSAGSSIFSFLTGLQKQNVTDLNILSMSLKDQKATEKYVQDHFIKEFRRGLDSQEHSPEQAQKFFTRAFTYLEAFGVPEDRKTDFISMAARGNETLIERLDWTFYMKGAPSGKEIQRMEAFAKKQRVRNETQGVE